MKDFVSLSDRIADSQPSPARDGHFHQVCQHWCFRYGCTSESCGGCVTAAANARMRADYLARERAAGRMRG